MDCLDYNSHKGNFAHVSYYRSAGLNVMPLRVDASKAPKVKWSKYQLEWIPERYVFPFFRERAGIGVICGETSGGLEVFDFDQGGLYYRPWRAIVEEYCPDLLTPAPV